MGEFLGLNRQLVADLTDAGVRFCHWKSNLRLDAALRGDADLDLLVHPDDRAVFGEIVEELGFVEAVTPPIRRLPGVEDRLGMDDATCRLVHLHVHYELVLGEQRVKNHTLPITSWVLTDVRLLHGMPIPAPDRELFLLYLRATLKSGLRAAVRTWLGRQPTVLPAPILDEAAWLLANVGILDVTRVATSAGLPRLAEGFGGFVERIAAHSVDGWWVVRQKRHILRELRPYNRYSVAGGLTRKAWLRLRYSRPGRSIARIPRKRLRHPGPYVAIVGADGSGKTTMAVELTSWLSWKLDVMHVFFGLPKRDPWLRLLRRSRYAASRAARIDGLPSPIVTISQRCASLLRSFEWLHVASMRRRIERRSERFAAGGGVVIAERYPFKESWTSMDVAMDGPRLDRRHDDPSWAIGRERRLYDGIGSADPVLVIAADLKALRARRPDDDPDRHLQKFRAIEAAAESGRYAVIDGNQPLEQVILDAKRRVWTQIVS